jgi:glycosyltransferase involved in cell wall biosynthesis
MKRLRRGAGFLRIAIDYTPALRQRAGIGRFTRSLVEALVDVDHTNHYTLFNAGGPAVGRSWPPNVVPRSVAVAPRTLTVAWHRLHLPLPVERFVGECDIYHSTDYTLPPRARAAGIVTIHDLSFLRYPQFADRDLAAFLRREVPRSVAHATHVLADSESTKRDLIELLDVPSSKVSVVPGGVDATFHPVRDTHRMEEVRQRYGLPERFILFVGTIEPRKNLARLISAYALLRRGRSIALGLVLAGGRGWLSEDIFERVEKEQLADSVRFTGYVPEEDLPALYSMADLFVFPSLYEGFGLPPLEAMACGTPVVVSNNSSLPEAVGEAAVLFDAGDEDALARAMALVLDDALLQARLRKLGLQQAKRYNWSDSAGLLLEAYGRAAG